MKDEDTKVWFDIETGNLSTYIEEQCKADDEIRKQLSQPLQPTSAMGHAMMNAMMPHGVTVAAHSNTFGHSMPPWTHHDQEKLSVLEKERAIRTRELKLEHFMKLPQSVRQDLVDALTFFDTLNKINNDEAGYTNEHQDMINKRDFQSGRHMSFQGSPYPDGMVIQFDGPYKGFINAHFHPYNNCGLTLEHLVKAHTDQTMEEVVLTPDKP